MQESSESRTEEIEDLHRILSRRSCRAESRGLGGDENEEERRLEKEVKVGVSEREERMCFRAVSGIVVRALKMGGGIGSVILMLLIIRGSERDVRPSIGEGDGV